MRGKRKMGHGKYLYEPIRSLPHTNLRTNSAPGYCRLLRTWQLTNCGGDVSWHCRWQMCLSWNGLPTWEWDRSNRRWKGSGKTKSRPISFDYQTTISLSYCCPPSLISH